MSEVPVANTADLPGERPAEKMIDEGCPNTGPFFWQRDEQPDEDIKG